MVSAIKSMFGKKTDAKTGADNTKTNEKIEPVKTSDEQANTTAEAQTNSANETFSVNTANDVLDATMNKTPDDIKDGANENVKSAQSATPTITPTTDNQIKQQPVVNTPQVNTDEIVKTDISSIPSQDNVKSSTQNEEDFSGSSSILEVLKKKGLITHDQIRTAEVQADKYGGSVVDALIQMNFVTESVVHSVFEKASEIEENKPNIVDMIPDLELIKKIPTDFALEHKVIPMSSNGSIVKVATNNPYDIVLLDQLNRMFEGLEVEVVPYGEVELTRAVDKFYRGNVINDFADILNELEINVDDAKRENGQLEGSPVARFINALIYEAIKDGASDIHIEPDHMFVRVRFRVDGVLVNKTIVHKNYWSSICVRIKVMSGMNIAESKKPQDGAITMTLQGREIDFRVSSLPTIYGENIVIRVLDKTQGLTSLDELGFNKANLKLINLAVQKPEGIVVVTGPTGSGKTTTSFIFSSTNKTSEITSLPR